MKILYYSPHPHLNLSDPSGYGTHMREMINAFKENGHTVETLIIGGEGKKQSSSEIKPSKIKTFLKSIIPVILWETLKDYQLLKIDKQAEEKLFKKVKEYKPDFIYERYNYLQVSGGNVSQKLNIKHLLEVNSPYIYERKKYVGNSLLISQARKNEQYVFENCHKLVVVSSTLKDEFKRNYSIDDSRIVITPNAVNLSSISVDNDLKSKLMNKYKFEDKLVVGFVGSIADWHGIENIIYSMNELKNKYDDLRLLIVGGGERLDYFKNEAKRMSIDHLISFTDKVESNKVFTYIDCMDIAVLPKTNDYMSPIKIFEYGVMNKAIVAPDVQSVQDVMKDNVDGLLVEEGVANLSSAIDELISNKEKRKSIAESFRKKVVEKHTWSKMAQKVLGN